MHRRTLLGALICLTPAALSQSKQERLRGILMGGPALKTSDGKMVRPTGDEPTMGVLNDARLRGMDMELLGHYDGPEKFTVEPIHTRSIFVYRNGKRLMVTYWCDVCALRFYTPGKCWCCQQETNLDLREPDEK